MEQDYVVGVDIGAQSAKIGIVDRKGNILLRLDPPLKTNQTEDDKVFLEELHQAIKGLIEKAGVSGKIKGIGVGAPNGNYYEGTTVQAANLTWGKDRVVKVAEVLSKKFGGLRVKLTNDANAAAEGEMKYGAAIGMKDFIMITLGTGVGSGIVVNGQVVYGKDGFAGELGHTVSVRYNGRQCNCGKTGCLETYTSAMGIARTAREYLDAGFDLGKDKKRSLLRDITEPITSKDIAEAAEKGDALAKAVFEYTGKKLGESLSDFVAFSAPEAIILFGGVTKAGDLIMEPAKRYMNENMLSLWKNKVPLIFSKLDESDAAILGASALAW